MCTEISVGKHKIVIQNPGRHGINHSKNLIKLYRWNHQLTGWNIFGTRKSLSKQFIVNLVGQMGQIIFLVMRNDPMAVALRLVELITQESTFFNKNLS